MRVILAALAMHYMSYHPKYSTVAYCVSQLLDAVDGHAARYLGQASKFGAVLDMVTDRYVPPLRSISRLPILVGFLWSGTICADDRATTSCLLCYLSSAYPQRALIFQFLIALDFSSHYMHMYRYLVHVPASVSTRESYSFARSSLVTGSKSHKLVTSDVSRILWFYYNDPVRLPHP
jgi:CDP-diacylglycerol--inositol 3-phosphatidyltransferase